MKKVTDSTFQKLVLEATKPVLVDFYTPTCGPCRMLAPILEKLAKARTDVEFVKLDASTSVSIADEYNISSVPTLLLVKDGEVLNELVGLSSQEDLTEWLDEHLNG